MEGRVHTASGSRSRPIGFLSEHYDFAWRNESSTADGDKIRADDLLVFAVLESLGTLAITGNVCLVVVLLRHKYLNRASFVLMLSLALADVLHGLVTTSFFYPPILLRQSPVPAIGVRIFNVLDWTAWSITLTHMSAICLDRLLAIQFYGHYNRWITVQRARKFTMACWTTFLALNSAYVLARFCCLITPLRASHFYTFGYGEFEQEENWQSPLGGANLFKLTYTPLELTTLTVLSISNPITLVQLYRRHKRKMALRIPPPPPTVSSTASKWSCFKRHCQRRPPAVPHSQLRPSPCPTLPTPPTSGAITASTMLIEVSMRMGSKHVSSEVQQVASRKASRQQQRILLQITVVAVIFYLYMSVYYLLYHVFNVSNKWVVLFNSFFYSITHMINPVIYFSLNKEMRAQLIKAIADFLNWLCCVGTASMMGGATSSAARLSRRGVAGGVVHGESSSGGSVLMRKSSPEAASSQQSNWTLRTYRLPVPHQQQSSAHKHPWLISAECSSSAAVTLSEQTPLLLASHHLPGAGKTPLAPPPTASASFASTINPSSMTLVERRQIHDDPNNNGPLNNNTIGEGERAQMAELAQAIAQELVTVVVGQQQTMAPTLMEGGREERGGERLTVGEEKEFSNNEEQQSSSSSSWLARKAVTTAIHLMSRRHQHSLSMPALAYWSKDNFDDGGVTNWPLPIGHQQRQLAFSNEGMSSSTSSMEQDGEGEQQHEEEEQKIELEELVESWSVQTVDEGGGASGNEWLRKGRMDGLRQQPVGNGGRQLRNTRERGLGSFLAHRLANEVAKRDRHWARARRQRNALLDTLVRALGQIAAAGEQQPSEAEEEEDDAEVNGQGPTGRMLLMGERKKKRERQRRRKKSRSMEFTTAFESGGGTSTTIKSNHALANGWPYPATAVPVVGQPHLKPGTTQESSTTIHLRRTTNSINSSTSSLSAATAGTLSVGRHHGNRLLLMPSSSGCCAVASGNKNLPKISYHRLLEEESTGGEGQQFEKAQTDNGDEEEEEDDSGEVIFL